MYSFEEVRKHNVRKDCWLIIAGKVRNRSIFLLPSYQIVPMPYLKLDPEQRSEA